MDVLISSIETLTENAKKSINRPYKIETINGKLEELTKIQTEAEKILSSKEYSKEFRAQKLTEFIRLKTEYIEVLQQHKTKTLVTEDTETEPEDVKMETKEIIEYMKIIPIFTGDRKTLENFISTVQLIADSLPDTKKVSFFDFIFKNRIEAKIQNKIKQLENPQNITELLKQLQSIFRPKRTANSILSQLTRLTQGDHTIIRFSEYIETLIIELTELQTIELGESHRPTIASVNYSIALNTFKNGLNDRSIIQTLNAAKVKTFQEAIAVAEEARMSNIAHRSMHRKGTYNNQNNHGGNSRSEQANGSNKNTENRDTYNNRRTGNHDNHGNRRQYYQNNSSNQRSYNDNRNHQANRDQNWNRNRVNYVSSNNENQGNDQEPEIVNQNYAPDGQEE